MDLEQYIEKYTDWYEHSEGIEQAVVEEALSDFKEIQRLTAR